MSIPFDLKTLELPEVDFEGIESVHKEQEQAVESEVPEIEFDMDEEEFNKGIKRGSYFAGVLGAMLSIGIPSELAVDVLINDEQIAFNKTIRSEVMKEEVINEELQRH